MHSETDRNGTEYPQDNLNCPGDESNQRNVAYRFDMDDTMEKIQFPFRKIKNNFYLVAVKTKEEIEKVIVNIQKATKVTWSVKQTRKFEAQSTRSLTLFKRLYGCHMATRRRTKTKNMKQKKSRNIDCPAQLIVTVRKYTTHTKSKYREPLLDENYPCSFEFRHNHNHPVDAVDVLKTRPLGDETKEAILKLLNKGHTCASAYHTYYVLKEEEFGVDNKSKMSDRHYFPKRNDISTLWKTHNFKEKSENRNRDDVLKNLENLLNSYHKMNGTLYRISIENDNYVVCICTPLMQRAVQQISEVFFIDSSNSYEMKEYKLYFILTQSSVGALPISCIISNNHSINMLTIGMKLFFEMINIQPTVILTSSEIMQELLLQKLFPSSKIILSFYHTLKSCCKFLYDARHEIAKGKKESYYQLFRDVVFSDNEEALVVSRQVLAVECAQQKFLNYVDTMYESINLWCLLYRQCIILRGVETFDYNQAEISFRLFRLLSEIPLERTKLFNTTQITDFMCSAFEKFYKNRIVEMVFYKQSDILKERYSAKLSTDDLQMEDIGHHQYLFKTIRKHAPEAYYQVDMITNLCTCATGITGKRCEHISEIIFRCNVFSPILSVEQKAAYYFVVTGLLKHKNSFLPDQQDLCKEYSIICCSSETGTNPETGTLLDTLNCESDHSESFPDFDNAKNKWISYCNEVLQHLEKDPAKFAPAINAHLNNVKKYSTSVPLLLKGLYAGFPYKGDNEKLPPLAIINKTKDLALQQGHSADLQCKQHKYNTTEIKDAINLSSWKNMNSDESLILDNSETLVQFTNVHKIDINNKTELENDDENMKIIENKPITFTQYGEIAAEDTIFNLQKNIFVHQAALNQLSHCDMAVLDEKKGILIIPISE
ncbi:uncharacterized protein LOC143202773 [Rhynchophorus ferrugineus]|uniref:uncharacterized protein LOC143202773 n=1 Tax=Rhynchophorus ferrugineus TaxID=354439 RepID=UPI003FCC72E9